MKIRLYFTSGPDEEKAVLPALIFDTRTLAPDAVSDIGIKGFRFTLGWWQWGITLSFLWRYT